MRRLALLLSLLFSACDSGGPDPTSADALVGLWASDVSYFGYAATSRTDQDVPDVSREAQSSLEVTGAVDAELTYLHYAYPSQGRAGFGTAAQHEPACGELGGCVTLLLERDGRVVMFVRSQQYTGPSDGVDIQQTAFGYAIAPITLTPTAGGASASVEGEIVLASLRLRAGQPTPVSIFDNSPTYENGGRAYDFRADGTYRYENSRGFGGRDESGTWEVETPGLVVLTTDAGMATEAAFEVREGALWIVRTPLATVSTGDLSEVEAKIGANPGSLTAVAGQEVVVYRR